jgi:hypothetical protein
MRTINRTLESAKLENYPYDLDNIHKQFEVYDSLYAWWRLDVARSKA